jgi:hypothetical protein
VSQSGIAIRGEHRTAIQLDPEMLSASDDLEEDGRLLEATLYNGCLAETYNALFAAMLARWRHIKAKRAVQATGQPVGVIYYPTGDVQVEGVQVATQAASGPVQPLRPASDYGNPDEGGSPARAA